MGRSLAQLAAECGGDAVGDASVHISSVASLETARQGQLTFFAGGSRRALAATQASAVLIRAGDDALPAVPAGVATWQVAGEPRRAFAQAIDILHPALPPAFSGVSPAAVVEDGAQLAPDVAVAAGAAIGSGARLGSGCIVHAGAVIGSGAAVGAHTVLHPRVVLYPCASIGSRCIVHAGAVIGADGFGYADNAAGGSDKIRQLGGVVIGDEVEIGANSAIDCGALDDTVIGSGVKIDNLVQIGHNVVVGDGTIICGKVGIAGSTRIGRRCVIGGGVGIAGHLRIGDNVKIAGASAVTRSIESGEMVSSVIPAMPIRVWRRFIAGLRRQMIAARR